jgi:hypothetical protein
MDRARLEGTSGNVTDGVWKPNIAGKKSPEPDDDPKVVQSAAWLINPACSRNQKSPPDRRWRIH